MADQDFEQAKAELAKALDERLSVTSKVDGSPQTLMSILAWIDYHVAVDIPQALRVTSRIDGGDRSLNDALGFIDEHVGRYLPGLIRELGDAVAAQSKAIADLTAAVAKLTGSSGN